MRIRLTGDARRHVVLDRSMIEDPRLSFRAKGLLAYLLSHPDADLSNKRALTSVSLEGIDAVETALVELEDAGYVRRGEEKDEEGISQPVAVVSPVSRIPVLEPQPEDQPIPSRTKDRERTPMSRKDGDGASAQRIISRLNELRERSWDWARYTPLSAKYAKNVEHINGRLADGFAEADLILVLEYLAAVDGGKEESRKYFDCVTPFNTKNFERNLAMARDWDARGRPRSQPTLKHELEQSHDPSIYDRGRRGGTP
jgi:hypothetical protein